MEKFYSAILLISFMTGIIQPVIPMAEYHFNVDNIIEFFLLNGSNSNDIAGKDTCTMEYCNESDCHKDHNRELLNLDYYPIPYLSCGTPGSVILPFLNGFYVILNEDVKILCSTPVEPPPKYL